MEGGALFNPGFIGGSFIWWLGQIADNSSWRENELSGKFDNAESIKGWGYRYKVRIMGMHPMSNDILPSVKLKFANVMYGVTDGGGQGGTMTSPAIRPGNFVFGFFMDQHENVPIIMGILGNNSQTELQGKTEVTGGKPFKGISGFSTQGGDKDPQAVCTAGPGDRGICRPKSKSDAQEGALVDMMNSNIRSLAAMNTGGN